MMALDYQVKKLASCFNGIVANVNNKNSFDMKGTTFTIEIPKPKGWHPKIKQPKKLFLFSVMLSLFGVGKKKQTCKNCKFNNEQYCTAGTYYVEKGLNKICYEGELWEGE